MIMIAAIGGFLSFLVLMAVFIRRVRSKDGGKRNYLILVLAMALLLGS